MESIGPQEISTLALVICFFMLLIPLILSLIFKLQIIRSMFMSIILEQEKEIDRLKGQVKEAEK